MATAVARLVFAVVKVPVPVHAPVEELYPELQIPFAKLVIADAVVAVETVPAPKTLFIAVIELFNAVFAFVKDPVPVQVVVVDVQPALQIPLEAVLIVVEFDALVNDNPARFALATAVARLVFVVVKVPVPVHAPVEELYPELQIAFFAFVKSALFGEYGNCTLDPCDVK